MSKTIKSETIFKNNRFCIKQEDVMLNEQINSYTFIDKSDAVGVIAVVEDDIWLVEQYRHSINKRLLEIPGGKIEKGETPLEAAFRELKEETGLIAGKMKQLTKFFIHPSLCNEEVYIFIATNFEFKKNNLEKCESDLKIVKINSSDLKNLIIKGEIASSADGYALLYYLNTNK